MNHKLSPLISSERDYDAVMQEIHALMKKGEQQLTEKEVLHLQSLVSAAQKFEEEHYALPMPTTLSGMISMKMFEMKMKQKEMAALLGITESKLSQILNGKREPDVEFLKAIYTKLKIDPKFILEHI
jgi:HTH-type transcriptional regulator/antitoxin HigA